MKTRFYNKVLNNSNVITENWFVEIEKAKDEGHTARISNRLFESTNREFVDEIFSSIKQKGSLEDGSTEALKNFARKLISLGWPLSYITDGLQAFRRVAIEFVLSESEKIDSVYLSTLLSSADEWVDPIIRQLVNEYSGSWEQVVSLQRLALQELSAPLIPVMDRITVMPLIGTIDTERAKLIMENLLEGVITHNAEVVLIDITGVPIVDTMVAHHIIQAAEAVRLIGSKCILVGIRPEIAHTIVSLGIDLSDFSTKSSLRKGFTAALELTNRKIINVEEKEKTIDDMIKSLK